MTHTEKIHAFAKRYVGIEETSHIDPETKKAMHSQLRSDAGAECLDISSISFGNILSQNYEALKKEVEQDAVEHLEKLKAEFKQWRDKP